MTKAEHVRLVAWRSKFLQHAAGDDGTVAQTCRYFGISRKTFYKWKHRQASHGDAGLCDRSRVARRYPRATPPEVVSKILYLRQQYHFGAGRIADYLRRFHQVVVADQPCIACCASMAWAGYRPIRSIGPTTSGGNGTKSRSQAIASRWM